MKIYLGTALEIKRILKWVSEVTDGEDIEEFLYDAAETYMDTLESPSVATVNDCLWWEADNFVDFWKANNKEV